MDSETYREQNCHVAKQEFEVIIQAEEERDKKKGYVSVGVDSPCPPLMWITTPFPLLIWQKACLCFKDPDLGKHWNKHVTISKYKVLFATLSSYAY